MVVRPPHDRPMACARSPFATRGAAVRLHRARAGQDRRRWSTGCGEDIEDVDQHTLRSPPDELVAERLVGTVRIGRILLAAAKFHKVDHAADRPAIIHSWLDSRVGRTKRHEPLKPRLHQPELLSAHGDLPSEIV